MTEETELIIEALEKVADKIGEGGDYLWPLLIQKVQIDWIVNFGISTFFLIPAIVVSVISIKKLQKKITETKDKDLYALLIIPGILLSIAFMAFFINLSYIGQFLIPEVEALRQLTRIIK